MNDKPHSSERYALMDALIRAMLAHAAENVLLLPARACGPARLSCPCGKNQPTPAGTRRKRKKHARIPGHGVRASRARRLRRQRRRLLHGNFKGPKRP